MTRDNIERVVKSLSLSGHVVENSFAALGIEHVHSAIRPSYKEELDQIVEILNKNFCSDWRELSRSKRQYAMINTGVESSEYAWKTLNLTLKEFSKWIEAHSNVFTIDHNYANSTEELGIEDIEYG